MHEMTYQMVKVAIEADSTLSANERMAILAFCRKQTPPLCQGALQQDHTSGPDGDAGRETVSFASDNGTTLPSGMTTDGSVKTEVPGDGWLETEQVASYLHLTPKTVREGAARGTLPGHKYPANSRRGRWRFKASELDAWVTRKPCRPRTKGLNVW